MAERRPLVVSSGKLVELPTGDTIPVGAVLPAGSSVGQVLKWNGTAWVAGTDETGGGGGGGLSPGDVLTTARTLAAPNWLKCDGSVYLRSSYPAVEALLPTPPADGVTWTGRTLPTSTNWYSVTYGGGLFVAVAYSSTIAATNSGDPTKFIVPQITDPALCRTYIKATT